MRTQALYDRWCWRHRGRYMQLWAECKKEGLPTNECRLYAKLEIVRLVESGQLSGDMTDVTPIDDVSKDPLIPKVGAHVPSEDRAAPSEDEAQAIISQVIGPLPANPPQAPLKLKPRTIGNLTQCPKCRAYDPNHMEWCSYVPHGVLSKALSMLPSSAATSEPAPVIKSSLRPCIQCNYVPPYHTMWCTLGHQAAKVAKEIKEAEVVVQYPDDFIGPRHLKPGDKMPARFPFLKDKTVPYVYAPYYGGGMMGDEFDEQGVWRGYD